MGKGIEPYNEVWLDCYNNLKISLLVTINPMYVLQGYENIYEYFCDEKSLEDGAKVNCISEEQFFFGFSQFSEVKKINPGTEEEFLTTLVNHLGQKNHYALIYVDLYDWMEGSVCWHQYHWEHFALIVDYDPETDSFIAFDEVQAQYKKMYIKKDKLYGSLALSNEYDKLCLLTISDDFVLNPISMKTLVDNAKKICMSIERCLNVTYWKMREDDYQGFWYRDLIGVYIQRIEGRQKANVLLFDALVKKNVSSIKYELEECRLLFERLFRRWKQLRLGVYHLYCSSPRREKKLLELNEKLEECLREEKNIWNWFIEIMEKEKNIDEIYLYK